MLLAGIISLSKVAANAQRRPPLQRTAALREGSHSMFLAFGLAAILPAFGFASCDQAAAVEATPSTQVETIAFLDVKFQNDHEVQEPTTDAERARLASLEAVFKSQLEGSGHYRFILIPSDIKAKIVSGPSIGECGGCEIDYGKKLGSDLTAWVVVQKVSNLILNINLYIVDVATQNPVLVQSVDIRGNTDQSWTRGMRYLVKHHVLTNGNASTNQ
jgi:hypothetical protein